MYIDSILPYILKKKIYEFANNRIKLEHDDTVKCIDSIWINKNNIKTISMFLIKDNIDINTINVDTSDYENHAVQVIHKIDINALIIANKIYGNDDPEILFIPYIVNTFIPNFLHSVGVNMSVLFVIDPIENVADKKHELIIKYLIALDQAEIDKFKNVGHEYLVRRLESYHHIIISS